VIDPQPGIPFLQDQKPADVPIWREILFGIEWLALHASPVYSGLGVRPGDGSGVVLVPGFLGDDWYLQELYWWFRRIGYRPYMSKIGRNADCLDLLVDRLLVTIEKVQAETGGKVHLVGHSLGGMFARAAACRKPGLIASVAALGSPFRGIRSHPLVLNASDRVRARIHLTRGHRDRPDCYTGYCTCETVTAFQTCFPSSIPQIAVYTKTDGIVDWQFCINDDGATNFEVAGTHVGLVWNPAVYQILATHIAATRSATTASRRIASRRTQRLRLVEKGGDAPLPNRPKRS
jgi:triacylglycerol lipase